MYIVCWYFRYMYDSIVLVCCLNGFCMCCMVSSLIWYLIKLDLFNNGLYFKYVLIGVEIFVYLVEVWWMLVFVNGFIVFVMIFKWLYGVLECFVIGGDYVVFFVCGYDFVLVEILCVNMIDWVNVLVVILCVVCLSVVFNDFKVVLVG